MKLWTYSVNSKSLSEFFLFANQVVWSRRVLHLCQGDDQFVYFPEQFLVPNLQRAHELILRVF